MTAHSIRKEYTKASLNESDVAADPFQQFRAWFDEALAFGVAEVNAMTLATATKEGRPSARIVLLKGFDERGFSFFTNQQSRKGRELDSNPFASLVFYWIELERQVRVEGRVERVSDAESDAYFFSRPIGARLGAWASSQSEVVSGRDVFEGQMEDLQARYPDGHVPRPPHWGGYRVIPDSVEFWQGRPSRLHDRILYRRRDEGGWRIERLAP